LVVVGEAVLGSLFLGFLHSIQLSDLGEIAQFLAPPTGSKSISSTTPTQASIDGFIKPLVRFNRFADIRMLKILIFQVLKSPREERRPEDL
ncbi:unnamed protein product, partial [Arabidopsis halleri]